MRSQEEHLQVEKQILLIKKSFLSHDLTYNEIAFLLDIKGKDYKDLVELVFYLAKKPRAVQEIKKDFKVDRTTVYNWITTLQSEETTTNLIMRKNVETKMYWIDPMAFFKLIESRAEKLYASYKKFKMDEEKKLRVIMDSPQVDDLKVLRDEYSHRMLRDEFFNPNEPIEEIWTFLPNKKEELSELYETNFSLVENIKKISKKATISFASSKIVNEMIEGHFKDYDNIHYYSYKDQIVDEYVPKNMVTVVKVFENKSKYNVIATSMMSPTKFTVYDTIGDVAEEILRNRRAVLRFGLLAGEITTSEKTKKSKLYKELIALRR